MQVLLPDLDSLSIGTTMHARQKNHTKRKDNDDNDVNQTVQVLRPWRELQVLLPTFGQRQQRNEDSVATSESHFCLTLTFTRSITMKNFG